VRQVAGYEREIVFDASKPDGSLRKVLDVSRLRAMDWQASRSVQQGLALAFRAFVTQETRI